MRAMYEGWLNFEIVGFDIYVGWITRFPVVSHNISSIELDSKQNVHN